MIVNTNVYGDPSTWYTPTGAPYEEPALKLPTWGDGYYNHLFYGAFQEDVLQINGAPIDKSPALWGVGAAAPISNPVYYYPGLAVDNDYEYIIPPEVYYNYAVHTDNGAVTPLMLSCDIGYSGAFFGYAEPYTQYTPFADELALSVGQCAPVLDFKYNNIIFVPHIIAAKNNEDDDSGLSFSEFSISQYFDDGGQEEYKYIVGVIAKWYYGSSSTSTRHTTSDYRIYYPGEYAAHVSSWEGDFSQYQYGYYSVMPQSSTRISGAYNSSVDSSFNFSFSANQSFVSESEAFARFTRIGSNPTLGVLLDNGKYEFKAVANRGYCTVTPLWSRATKEEVLRECAFLGFWFCDDDTTAISTANGRSCTSDKMHLPLFDEQGVTTGDYVSGEAAAALAPADDTTAHETNDYNPDASGGGGAADKDVGDLDNITVNRFTNAGGLKQYVVSQQTLLQLTGFLNGTYLPTSADLDADFKGTNPQDYVVSAQKYPFELPNVGSTSTIYVGNQNTGLSGYPLFADWGGLGVLPINSKCTYSFGDISLTYRNYNDFRDYQSKLLLFLPFIGTAELDPRIYMYHTLGLIYTIDFNTGATVAEIKRDGLTMETKTGNISITVPFMAANMGSYQNQLAQLDYSKQMAKIRGVQTALSTGFQIGSAAMGAASTGSLPGLGNLSAIAAGATQLAANATTLSQIDYQIEHTAPSVGTLSTASAANSWFMDPRARLIITRPVMSAAYNAAQYSHTIGNACCKTGKLSSFRGFTQCASAVLDNVRTSNGRAATEQEQQILRRALLNGIYL